MLKLSLFILSLLLIGQGMAMQLKEVADNETITAKISSSDITRIGVKGDRIKNVKGIKGSYTHENDEVNGEIYIQPTVAYQHRAFTLLIATESDRHFTLLLNPLSAPSDAILLVPKGMNQQPAGTLAEVSDYESTLIHLIRDISNGALPEGYAYQDVQSAKKYTLGQQAELILKTRYEGATFQGEIYELVNRSSDPLILDEHQFYSPLTRAISLQSLTVAPFSNTHIIRVVKHV